ncbi:PLP-dependent aminotransferase family protein [Aerococcus urinae]|uniref:PLP-dependent aminotransferase family protein n=1 Tax=Aerococcus urinae TaxID=1376 RepID=A0A109REL1_9LACT|nr:PLP-dependent aminotransferase family protein [Aerococcus urinae]AMB96066.1 GntR family transcriptional regulator [Aerococcus urinae]MCY3033354.1 PLP-dependent aminotransferase family protein [Aerococcus urinae]MCY3045320.1 PLP-dependent aminotransferase family protein [Aerococcus urinae]MCY3048855.1 PLP-dependent aminotransferase family protein [Aerococcus urinae]MCY3052197.1 PLP-dependent aminotransferase family protein [Aerococcus urinae]
MLTYHLKKGPIPLYQQLYQAIKSDIIAGKLENEEKLPSKRSLARNLGVSTITVENAYDQLILEGLVYSREKRGYYVNDWQGLPSLKEREKIDHHIRLPEEEHFTFNFSEKQSQLDSFPFSIMNRMMHDTIANYQADLLKPPLGGGVAALREAIASHLASFRGMAVDPKQIIVGAGTEYLYGLLIQLLGRDKVYCIENPGYPKLRQIYTKQGVACRLAGIDNQGLRVEELEKQQAQIAHLNPTHHFPTGTTMPVSRRYQLLAWANQAEGRYIIEDDYDSEFRFHGKPLPTLQSIDASAKVIYLNTFSKSLAPTIRISYMVLPAQLANRFYQELAFYSCTVSTFEQYSLAQFIREGYFEKHINRMRRHYSKKREKVTQLIKDHFPNDQCQIIEGETGLHLVLKLQTSLSDREVKDRLLKQGIGIKSVSDYDMEPVVESRQLFLLNDAAVDLSKLQEALAVVKAELFS